MATVRIPTPLRTLTGGADEVVSAATTVRGVIDDLETKHPGLRDRLTDEKGVRRFVNIYVGDEDIRFLQGLDTEVSSTEQISVIPAIAGGLTILHDATRDPSVHDVRYLRHLVLREIGEEGQARLLAATAQLPRLDGFCGEVARRYTERAGFGNVEENTTTSRPTIPDWITTPSAISLLMGSLAALAAIRDAVVGEATREVPSK